MPKIIQEKLRLTERQAQEIASRVVSEIFKPAMDDIKKMQLEKFKERIVQANNAPTNNQQAQAVNNVIDLREEQK